MKTPWRIPLITLAWATLLFSSLSALGQVDIDKSGWQVVFEDDFNDPSTLGPNSTKWVNGYDFGQPVPVLNSSNLAYNTWSNIVLNNGVAEFYARDVSNNPIYYAPYNKNYNYTSGAISCKYDDVAYSNCQANGSSVDNKGFLYGMFEIKCKMPKGSGRLGAFWLYGADCEADVFEFDGGTPNLFSSNIHYLSGGVATACQTGSDKVSPYDLTEDYHTYTLVWTPTALTYFFDGREIRTDTQLERIPRGCDWRRMKMCIDSEIWWTPSNFNSPFSVDYVRVYKPINNNPYDPQTTYANTPYKRNEAINTIHCLTWGEQVADEDPDPCASVQTKEMGVSGNDQVFYRNDNGNMMVNYYNNSQWHNASLDWSINNVAGNVTCSKTASNVFYSDSDGKMFNFWYDNGWHNACLDWNINDVSNNVVTQYNAVIYRNSNGGLSDFYYDNGWHHATIYWGSDVSSCQGSVAIHDNEIFYKGTDNNLYHIHYTAAGWGTPVQIPAVSNISNSLALSVNPARPGLAGYRVYYIGANHNVYCAYMENGQWVNYSLDWRINNASSDLCVYNEQVYYKGTDNRLWNHYFYESAWRVSPINYNTTPAVKGGLSLGSDGKVYFVDTDRYIYSAYSGPSTLVNPPCSAPPTVISNRTGLITDPSTSMATSRANQQKATATSSSRATTCTSVVIYDSYGNLVKTTSCNDVDASTGKSLGLTTGFYVLRFLNETGEVIKIKKMMVTN